jgi:hypothetical protein
MNQNEKQEVKKEVSEEIKEKIFELISTAGVEIEDIVKEVGLDYDTIMEILSEEYLRYDLDHGRRMCCKFT